MSGRPTTLDCGTATSDLLDAIDYALSDGEATIITRDGEPAVVIAPVQGAVLPLTRRDADLLRAAIQLLSAGDLRPGRLADLARLDAHRAEHVHDHGREGDPAR